jgi:hypothetical protein
MITTLSDTLKPLEELSNAWDAHNAVLNSTITTYENLGETIQGILT